MNGYEIHHQLFREMQSVPGLLKLKHELLNPFATPAYPLEKKHR